MKATLQMLVPKGTGTTTETVDILYHKVLNGFQQEFPGVILNNQNSVGYEGESLLVTPLNGEHLRWIRLRIAGWHLRSFIYVEDSEA